MLTIFAVQKLINHCNTHFLKKLNLQDKIDQIEIVLAEKLTSKQPQNSEKSNPSALFELASSQNSEKNDLKNTNNTNTNNTNTNNTNTNNTNTNNTNTNNTNTNNTNTNNTNTNNTNINNTNTNNTNTNNTNTNNTNTKKANKNSSQNNANSSTNKTNNQDMDVEKKEEEYNCVNLPKTKEETLDFYQNKFHTTTDNNEIDNTVLYVALNDKALTWGKLVALTTHKDFEVLLDNGLKDKDLTDKKLFIIARFKRNLSSWCTLAEKALRQREALLKKKSDSKFEQTVDQWLLNTVNTSIEETKKLLNIALSSKKQNVASSGGFSLNREDQPGESEVLLATCKNILQVFSEACSTINKELIKIDSLPILIYEVYPHLIEDNNLLAVTYRKHLDYLNKSVYDKAYDDAYQEIHNKYSWSSYVYSTETGESKRKAVIESIIKYAHIFAAENKLDTLYPKLLNRSDAFNEEMKAYTPTLSLAKLTSSYKQHSDELCEDLHKMFFEKAQISNSKATEKHAHCFK